MSRCTFLLLVCLALFAIPEPALAVTITWTGNGGTTSWFLAANWNLNRLPMAGDDVSIPDLPGTTSVVYGSAAVTSINSLNCAEVFTFSAGTLTIATASSLTNNVTVSGGTLNGAGNIQISGEFTWTGGTISGTGTTTLENTATLEIGVGGAPVLLRVLQNDGYGNIAGPLTITSPGVLRNRSLGFLTLEDVIVGGNGLVDNQAGATLSKFAFGTGRINCTLTNNGNVEVPFGTLIVNGFTNYAAGILTGGTYHIEGTFQYDSGPVSSLAANVILDGTSSQFLDSNGANALANLANITSAGSLTLDDGRDLGINGDLTTRGVVTVRSATSTLSIDDGYQQNQGRTILDLGTIHSNQGIVIQGGTLEGNGTVSGFLSNDGSVEPGQSAGTISVTGNYTQTAGGSLVIEVGGTVPGTGHDRLNVSGTASLNGHLEVSRINGFTFPDGVNYDVVSAATRSGTFASDNLPTGSGIECVDVGYTPTLVRLLNTVCPDTLFVNAAVAPGGNGQGWGTAFNDLQAALAAAGVNPHEIWVAQGSYKPAASDRNLSFVMRSKVELYGGFVGSESSRSQRRPDMWITRLSGDLSGNDGANFLNNGENSLHVLTGDGADSTSILDGFVIEAGNANSTGTGSTGGGLRVFNSGRPTVMNCTFAGNATTGNGGGIAIGTNASLRLIDCTLSGNKAGTGAGLYVTGTTVAPLVDLCRFLSNRATISGGAAAIGSSQMTMANCDFSGNQANAATAANGGAISLSGSGTILTLLDCNFIGNSVTLSGTASGVPRGGAFAMTAGTTAKFTRCLFMGNSYTAANGAVRGGAVGIVAAVGEFRQCRFLGNSITSGSDGDGGAVATISTGARATFLNCLFNANSASHDGGAVELNGTLASELRNCTVSGNSAGTAVGGLRVSSSGPVSLLNTILWDNRVGPTQNEAAQIAFTGSAFPASTLSSNDIEGWTGALGGAGNFSQDPDFTDPNGFDNIAGNLDDFLQLLPTSPCIDSGNNGNVLAEMTLDLAGKSRRQDDLCTVDTGVGTGSIVDRGAYEFQGDCVAGVGDQPFAGPAFRVGLPAPNPTAGPVTLTFALPAAGAVHAAVFDVAGRRVRLLVDDSFEVGEHAIRWNGADDDDRPVAGGLYFVRVEAAGRSAVRKVVVR